MLTAINVRVSLAEEIDSVVASVDGNPITSHDLKNPATVSNGPRLASRIVDGHAR